MHVVVIDDQPRLVELVTSYLSENGLTASGFHDGESGLTGVLTENPDAVVLDLMMPGLDGTELCRRLRALENDVPVIMLTARGEVSERVAGLESGADDYLVKPFAMEELIARIRAAVRRRGLTTSRLSAGDVMLDFDTRKITVAGQEITPARREFAVLATLMAAPGRVVSRDRLTEEVWDGEASLNSNALEVHVSRVRAQLKGSQTVTITTVRGVGYRLDTRR